jgi:hypothetical protein
MEDIRFKRGMRVLQQRRFEEAIMYFSDLLQVEKCAPSTPNHHNCLTQMFQVHTFTNIKFLQVKERSLGPLSIDLAPVYLEYGKALLEKSKQALEEETAAGERLAKQEEVRFAVGILVPNFCILWSSPLISVCISRKGSSSDGSRSSASTHLTHKSRLLQADSGGSGKTDLSLSAVAAEKESAVASGKEEVGSVAAGKEPEEPYSSSGKEEMGLSDQPTDESANPGGLFDVKLHRRVSLSSLQIQEEDGEWRYGDLYEFETVLSTKEVACAVLRVVIHFGEHEFEGLGNDVYRLHLTGGGGFAFSGDPELGRVLDTDGDLVPTRSCEHPQQGLCSLFTPASAMSW